MAKRIPRNISERCANKEEAADTRLRASSLEDAHGFLRRQLLQDAGLLSYRQTPPTLPFTNRLRGSPLESGSARAVATETSSSTASVQDLDKREEADLKQASLLSMQQSNSQLCGMSFAPGQLSAAHSSSLTKSTQDARRSAPPLDSVRVGDAPVNSLQPEGVSSSACNEGEGPKGGEAGVGDVAYSAERENQDIQLAVALSLKGSPNADSTTHFQAVAPVHQWKQFIDPHTGDPYYHCAATNTTTWEKPDVQIEYHSDSTVQIGSDFDYSHRSLPECSSASLQSPRASQTTKAQVQMQWKTETQSTHTCPQLTAQIEYHCNPTTQYQAPAQHQPVMVPASLCVDIPTAPHHNQQEPAPSLPESPVTGRESEDLKLALALSMVEQEKAPVFQQNDSAALIGDIDREAVQEIRQSFKHCSPEDREAAELRMALQLSLKEQ